MLALVFVFSDALNLGGQFLKSANVTSGLSSRCLPGSLRPGSLQWKMEVGVGTNTVLALPSEPRSGELISTKIVLR